jgi:hypothetical protein
MEKLRIFKTKTGFCHLLPDKIVLTRDNVIGDLSKIVVGENIAKSLIVYGVFSCVLLYFAFQNYRKGLIFEPILFVIIAVLLIYGILTSLNNSSLPIIERQRIKQIKYKKAIIGLTRSRFEVYFENEDGKIKKRLIMLPGSLSKGEEESEKAINMMVEEKLLEIN